MHIPTEHDWHSEEWNPDTGWAYANFHKKTMEEAVRLFEDNAFGYQADLMYMPSRVIGFYLKAYIAYLMSDAAMGDPDAASCFIALIEFRLQIKRDDIEGLWASIEPVFKRLAERQADFDAEWAIYGSFRSRIHEIVRQGFSASFDTATLEIVPESVTMWDAAYGVPRPLPLAVAAQVIRNSGIDQIDEQSDRSVVFRTFGTPTTAGGGPHPKFGSLTDWFRYDCPNCVIRFAFDGEAISNVMFLPPSQPSEPRVSRADAFAAWEALFRPGPLDTGSDEDVRSKETNPRG